MKHIEQDHATWASSHSSFFYGLVLFYNLSKEKSKIVNEQESCFNDSSILVHWLLRIILDMTACGLLSLNGSSVGW